MRPKPIYIVVIALMIATLACAMPGGAATPDVTATFSAALTQAFGTAVAANATAVGAGVTATASATPGSLPPTPTQFVPAGTQVKPSDTPAPTNTPGAAGCSDGSEYVADVTIPDNTVLLPGQSFTKTWRIKNSGTCNWVSAYQFTFASGDQMSAPGSVAISGNVTGGSLYDVSVNMVAPTTPGTYKGSWRLKNAAGQFFGTTPFVQIVVAAPTSTNTAVPSATASPTVTATATGVLAPPVGSLTLSPINNGQIYSDNSTQPGVNNVGDDSSNRSIQAFLTFDLTGIPAGATILQVRLDLSSYDTLPGGTSPFDVLGCLRGYKQDYGTFDGSDYFSGSPSGALWRFCNLSELGSNTQQVLDSSGLSVFQSALGTGQFQIRLQFNEHATNSDSVANVLRPTAKLNVSFTAP